MSPRSRAAGTPQEKRVPHPASPRVSAGSRGALANALQSTTNPSTQVTERTGDRARKTPAPPAQKGSNSGLQTLPSGSLKQMQRHLPKLLNLRTSSNSFLISENFLLEQGGVFHPVSRGAKDSTCLSLRQCFHRKAASALDLNETWLGGDLTAQTQSYRGLASVLGDRQEGQSP